MAGAFEAPTDFLAEDRMVKNVPEESHGAVELLQQAARRRSAASVEPATNAFRIMNGPADGGPAGLTLDRYGKWMVLSSRTEVPEAAVRRWTHAALQAFDPDGVVVKRLAEDPRNSSTRVWGDRTPPIITVREGDAVFECRLDDGVHTGLFLDHRQTRWRARQLAAGVEVLNLFAYTCAFSVHAALAGATRVTSVDVSQRALSWGRRNMQHSGLEPDDHRWFADDVLVHLRRPRRQYGLVILDPPVFGHGRRPFSLLNDLDRLLDGALAQLADDGWLAFSTHHTSLGPSELEALLRAAVARNQLRLAELEHMGLPEWDHPVGPDRTGDRGDYLTTLLARVQR